MPSHDPGRKRGTWRVKPRVRVGRTKAKEGEAELEEFDTVTLNVENNLARKLGQVAETLWSDDYNQLMQAEQRELAALGLLGSSLELKGKAPPSTYTLRGLIRNVEEAAAKNLAQASDMAAVSVRQANQQTYPISICARSISMLTHRTPYKDWNEQLLARRVLSRPTAVKLVHLMMKCRPPPGFALHPGIALVGRLRASDNVVLFEGELVFLGIPPGEPLLGNDLRAEGTGNTFREV
jgi:hypothetical protein